VTTPNPFLDYLEADETGRRAAYFSYGDRFGGTRDSQRQRGFSQNQFSDVYSQYLGQLGRQARAGVMPSGTFNDYLGGFDFDQWYRQSVPYEQRNQGVSSLAPQTKFINPYWRQNQ